MLTGLQLLGVLFKETKAMKSVWKFEEVSICNARERKPVELGVLAVVWFSALSKNLHCLVASFSPVSCGRRFGEGVPDGPVRVLPAAQGGRAGGSRGPPSGTRAVAPRARPVVENADGCVSQKLSCVL